MLEAGVFPRSTSSRLKVSVCKIRLMTSRNCVVAEFAVTSSPTLSKPELTSGVKLPLGKHLLKWLTGR